MKWTVDGVNNVLWDNDCACTITRIEDDRGVRFEVAWRDSFGEVGAEDENYPLSTHYVNPGAGCEEAALRHIVLAVLVPATHLRFALEELLKVAPLRAQHQALFSWTILEAGMRKETILKMFGLEEYEPDCIRAIANWEPPKGDEPAL